MKLNNLQILRAIAALLVCCFHFRDYLNFDTMKLGELLFGKGGIGVPVFFVISGFIMVFTTRKIDFSQNISKQIITFYKRRIVRIIPLYYLLTFSWMILGGNFLIYFKGEQLSRLIHSILFLPQKDVFPVLYLGWSLNYEMFFYLIFGLSLWFKHKRYYFIAAFFILTYLAGSVFQFDNGYMEMVTSPLNLYFVTGILFALLLEKRAVPKKWAAVLVTTGISIFILFLLDIISVKHNLLILPIVSLFVLSFLLLDYTFRFQGKRSLIFLGDISYSLYLSHPFVGIIFKKFKADGYLNLPLFILQIIIIIVVAAFLYHFVEKKITEYLKQSLKA